MDFLLAAEIAQLKQFTFPNGTRLLHATGEFEKHSLKRLDDTRAILYEIGRDTFYSERAETMADHLNKLHGFYNIPNDEFIHTLSTFIFDVREFINRYGWRKLTRTEELSIYYAYVRMGEMMNIQNIPRSFEEYLEWKLAYERENQAYAESNRQVADGLIQGIKEMLPAIFRPFILPYVLSLMDPKLVELVGFKPPNRLMRGLFLAVMRVRQTFNRHFTLWDRLEFEEVFFSTFKTYPEGYHPLKLGPTNLINHLEAREAEAQAVPSSGLSNR